LKKVEDTNGDGQLKPVTILKLWWRFIRFVDKPFQKNIKSVF